jgi:hypothetical protein
MKKSYRLLVIALICLWISACGGPNIQGTYTGQKKVLFSSMEFSIKFLGDKKAIFTLPPMMGQKAKEDELSYDYDGDNVKLWKDGDKKQLVFRVEEEGAILRLVSDMGAMPEVWTKNR